MPSVRSTRLPPAMEWSCRPGENPLGRFPLGSLINEGRNLVAWHDLLAACVECPNLNTHWQASFLLPRWSKVCREIVRFQTSVKRFLFYTAAVQKSCMKESGEPVWEDGVLLKRLQTPLYIWAYQTLFEIPFPRCPATLWPRVYYKQMGWMQWHSFPVTALGDWATGLTF